MKNVWLLLFIAYFFHCLQVTSAENETALTSVEMEVGDSSKPHRIQRRLARVTEGGVSYWKNVPIGVGFAVAIFCTRRKGAGINRGVARSLGRVKNTVRRAGAKGKNSRRFKFGNKFKNIGNKFKNVGKKTKDKAKDAFNKVKDVGKKTKDKAKDAFGKVKDVGKKTKDKAKDAFGKVKDALGKIDVDRTLNVIDTGTNLLNSGLYTYDVLFKENNIINSYTENINYNINNNYGPSNPLNGIYEDESGDTYQNIHLSPTPMKCGKRLCDLQGPGIYALGVCTPFYCSCGATIKEHKCKKDLIFDPLNVICDDMTELEICGFTP